jgi:hypothetical protein
VPRPRRAAARYETNAQNRDCQHFPERSEWKMLTVPFCPSHILRDMIRAVLR